MFFMKLILHLSSEDGRTRDLTYQLYNNSASCKLIKYLETYSGTPSNTNWGIASSATSASVYDKLHQLTAEYGTFLAVFPALEELDQKLLNTIHDEFAKFLPLESNTERRVLLEKINSTIHLLEHIIRHKNTNSFSSFFTTVLSDISYHDLFKITDDDRKLFTFGARWGELFAGYASTGKNIEHIYHDGDLSLLKSGYKPLHQKYITSNIMGCFWDTDHNRKRKEIISWWRRNKLDSFGLDMQDELNNAGYLPIGHLLEMPPLHERRNFLTELSVYCNITNFSLAAS